MVKITNQGSRSQYETTATVIVCSPHSQYVHCTLLAASSKAD